MANCRICNTSNTYLSFSGFEDECVNEKCKFYSEKWSLENGLYKPKTYSIPVYSKAKIHKEYYSEVRTYYYTPPPEPGMSITYRFINPVPWTVYYVKL